MRNEERKEKNHLFMIMVGFLLFEPEALEGMDRSWRRRALFFAYFFLRFKDQEPIRYHLYSMTRDILF